MLDSIFKEFVRESPVSVMVRGLMERILSPERIEEIFENNRSQQYTRDLLFSNLVNLMSLVVCGIYPSVNAAYKSKAKEMNVTRASIYNKLGGIELAVSQALVRETTEDMAEIIENLGGQQPELLEGYQTRIIDGNCLAATDHRPEGLRKWAAKALPGKSLVVLAPALKLAVDVFPCEDAYTQERALFAQVIKTVQPGQLWIADRNMCTLGFLLGVYKREGICLVREHKSMPWKAESELESRGKTKSGELFEQKISISDGEEYLELRRLVLKLFKPTRNGESEIAILTWLPVTVADSEKVTELYRERWSVEQLFQTVTDNFEGEIKTLAYPKAALFSFCMALVAYNILAVVRAALGSVHGVGKVEAGLSDFYLVNEIQGIYRGMAIAIPSERWNIFSTLSLPKFSELLQELAESVHLKAFLKQPRKPKKKKPPLIVNPRHRHISTARILSDRKKTP